MSEPFVDSPGKTVGSDFNGDGIHDLIIGARSNDDTALNAGSAYILYGTGSFSATYRLDGAGVDVTLLGKAASDRFGNCVESAGDLNADGFDDIIVGADLNNDGPGANDAGAVYILYGSPNLSATIAMNGLGVDATILGKAATDQFGYSVSGAGDINGDGFDDIIAGAFVNDDIALNAGAAFILYGAASLSQTYNLAGAGVNVTLQGKASNDQLGVSVSGTGDMNRDGFDDIVVGAFRNNDGGTGDEGAAYILFGGSSLSATIAMNGAGANVTILGKAVNDYLGRHVGDAADINGDGFDDVIVGAFANDDTAGAAGAAYVIYGFSAGGTATIGTGSSAEDISLLGRATNHFFGFGASGAGDINDDGFQDLLVSAYVADDFAADSGTAYIFYGSSSLASSINAGNADVSLLGKAASDNFSFRVSAGAGDLNNDGFPDIALGANLNDDGGTSAGQAYIVFGSGSLSATINMAGLGPNVTITGKAADDSFGIGLGGGRNGAGP